MSLTQHYAEIRARLRNPPNAKRDEGIELHPKAPMQRQREAIAVLIQAQEDRAKQLKFERNCHKFFVWQCSPTPEEQRECRRRMRKIPPSITPAFIVRVVADHFGVSSEGIRCESKQPRFAHPRQIVYWLCRSYTRHSFPNIGRYLNRDHSTVMHGVRRIEERRHVDLQLGKTIDELVSQLVRPVKNANISEIVPTTPDQISFVDTSVASVLRSTSLENSDAEDPAAVSG
jgi:hypothetical protein